MKSIERSRLFMIIGAVVLVLLTVAIILISIFIPKDDANLEEEKTLEQVQQENIDEYFAGENGNEEAADIRNSENDPEAPPADAYENSYEDDFGYVPLTDHESSRSNPENSVYDDAWASNKWTELNCDLSNKMTVSKKSVESMQQFRKDLSYVGSDMSKQLIHNVDHLLGKLVNSRGERMPGEVKNITTANCRFLTEEVNI